MEITSITTRAVFITGCDTGFGNLLAKTLDAKGMKVFAGCLTEQGAIDLRALTSSRLKTVVIDITVKETVIKALKFVQENLDENGLWGVVNNAGVMPTFAPVEWTSMEEFQHVFNVNFFGSVFVTQKFLPMLRKSRGRLVNVCSVTSHCAYPGITTYVTSKAALKMFTVCLRRELYNSGVTTHTIEPGGFNTNITDKNRIANMVKSAYKQASPELQTVYGGRICKYLLDGIKMAGNYVSTRPQMVADAMTHALLSRNPQQRYIVGNDANVYFRILSWIPDKAVDFILGWPAPYGQACEDLRP
ncbi:retinol dehydrogenase 7-like isoform X1 [Mya arenaria]|uniref:retinol dehydrogenase 7-like isoform X1 n=1 Tax=Mya arenaria TaxID=6604 RepID=UPI0022E3BE22|nr:retinol dehydrogenase 7-like isoform X1 [Mya arenaria]XP_052801513.1 retinol dehydrogenase 7-like isoform X1 [Mya arenaria]XP_052801515.1 retinol dehydrogenase 7-like isoform X1 [Mya arenaria]